MAWRVFAFVYCCVLGMGCAQGGGGRVEHDAGVILFHDDDAGTAAAPDAGQGACTPSCAARFCGDDGCGGSCGACSFGESCMGGVCVGTTDAECPPNASWDGEGCYCNAGYIPSLECTSCIADADGDGCPANASFTGGSCACAAGYRIDGCGCVPDPVDPPGGCAANEVSCGTGCVPDPDADGCPPHADPLIPGYDERCFCDTGYTMSADGCTCVPDAEFTHPAFDATSCAGTPMTHAAAESRFTAGNAMLGSYQMVFRQRSCSTEGCGPWVEIPLRDVTWATSASGIAQLFREDGVMKVDLRAGVCDSITYGSPGSFIIGSRCSGLGATLACTDYLYPRVCRSDGTTYYYSIYNEHITFFGTLTDTCLRLQSDMETSGGTEIQAAVLLTF